jgi:hypothetical protein
MPKKQHQPATHWTGAAVAGLISGIARAITTWLLDHL